MSTEEINLVFSAIDNVSATVGNISNSMNTLLADYGELGTKTEQVSDYYEDLDVQTRKVDENTKKVNVSTKQTLLAFNNIGTSAMALYGAYDRLETSSVALDRANLLVKKSTEAVDQAQKNYNKAIEKYGADSPEAKDAADKLAIAQEALQVSTERASLASGNLSQSMISGILTVIPTSITMITSLSTAFEGLNMSLGVVAIIAILIGLLIVAYEKCEPFRNAVNALGTALYSIGETIYSYLKPAADAIIGALTWLWNNVLSPIIGVFKTLWDIITNNPILMALSGPIGWIIYAIQNWDSVTKGLSDGLTGIFNNVLKPIGDFLQAVLAFAIQYVCDRIGDLQKIWNALSGVLTSVWNNVLKPIADFLNGALTSAFDTVKKAADWFKGVLDSISSIGKGITDTLGNLTKGLLGLCFAHAAPAAELFNKTIEDSIALTKSLSGNLGDLGGDLRGVTSSGFETTVSHVYAPGSSGVGVKPATQYVSVQSPHITIGSVSSNMDLAKITDAVSKGIAEGLRKRQ